MEIPANLGVRLRVFDLPESIERNFSNIEQWCHQCGRSYAELKDATVAQILAGDLDDDSILKDKAIHLFQQGSAPNLIPITHSFVYSILAENAYEQGEIAKAWSFITEACHLSGVAQSFALQEQIRLSAAEKKAGALKGHKVRDKNDFHPTKVKAVELLRAARPEGGWLDAETAAQSILESLEKYIVEQGIKLKKENLLVTLRGWLKKDSLLSVEFSALRASA